MNAEGYPEFCIFRKKIGTEYDIRSDRAVRLKNCSILFCPEVSNWRGMSGVHSARSTMNVYFLPFVSSDMDIAFPTKVHDYTLNAGVEKLDEPYRSAGTVTASSSNAVFYCSDRTYFSMYSKPLMSGLATVTSGSLSQSLMVSQETDGGPVTLSFLETGTNGHSAGPHDIYATVRNKWSAQWDEPEPPVEVKLGSTNVYIHFICGSRYKSSGSSSLILSTEWQTDQTGAPNFMRTTVGQRYNDIHYAVGLSDGEISGFSNGDKASFTMSSAKTSSINGKVTGFVGETYAYMTVNYGVYSSGYIQGLVASNSPDLGRKIWSDQHFFNISSEEFVDELDVSWGENHDAEGNGFIVLHWLKNVCQASNGWLNVFEAM